MQKLTKKNKIILKNSVKAYKKILIYKFLTLFTSLKKFKNSKNFKFEDFKLHFLQFKIFKLSKLPKYSSIVKFKKNCLLSHRSRSTYSLFRLSRIKIKEFSWKGLLTGVTHSSW